MSSKKKVLFVDDEAQILRTIQRYFRQDEEIDADVIDSPVDSIRLLNASRYDAVVSDWSMPKMNGSEFLTVVAEKFPGVARGLMTGAATPETVARMVNRGRVARIFFKPISFQEMKRDIVSLIDQHGGASAAGAAEIAATAPTAPSGDLPAEGFSLRAVVERLLTVADSVDGTISAHARRVADRAEALFEMLAGRPNNHTFHAESVASRKTAVRYAALLHDLGKVFVDRKILKKDSVLGEDKVQLLRERVAFLDAILDHQVVSPANPADQRIQTAATLARRIVTTLSQPVVSPATWQRLGSDLGRLTLLTADVRERFGIPLVDTSMAEALFGSHIGTLTASERTIVEGHVEMSFHLASTIPWPEHLADIPYLCRHHHERLDGSGYPDGLVGHENHPLELRVIAVADVFDAMTDPSRTYRAPLTTDTALKEMRHLAAAGQLDREVVALASNLWGSR